MKANELRIGNCLFFDGKLQRVAAVDLDLDDESVELVASVEEYNFIELNSLRITPIPLTPEILEKCGFEKPTPETCSFVDVDFDKSYISPFDRKRLILSFDDNGPGQINTYWVENIGIAEVSLTFNIKYVHQLQNLYYALKGKELEIKELV